MDLEVWRDRLMPMLVARATDLLEQDLTPVQDQYRQFEALARSFAEAM